MALNTFNRRHFLELGSELNRGRRKRLGQKVIYSRKVLPQMTSKLQRGLKRVV